MRDDSAHVPELDGLRGIAALAVLVFHAEGALGGAHWHTVLARWSRGGWLGVDLFFALSGYLITRGLLRDRGAPLVRFYGRRVLRIFPLYYLYLAVVFALAPLPVRLVDLAPGDAALFAAYLGAVPGAVGHYPGHLLAPLWSVGVEEHFYLVWPLVLRGRNAPSILRACAAGAVVAVIARAASLAVLDPDAAGILTPCRLDALLAGAALAVVASTRGEVEVTRWCRARVGYALAWLAVVALTPLGPWSHHGVYPSRAYLVLGYTVTSVACAVIVGSVAHGAPPVPWLRARPLVYVGRVSYGVYLLHMAVGAVLYHVASRWRGEAMEAWVAVWVAVTVVVAAVVHRVVETPFQRLRRYLP